MSISDTELWDLVGHVMAYSVDSSARMNLNVGETSIASIDEEVFLSQLYAVRDDEAFEESLVSQLISAPHLICVAGGRGCGKTSAIHYAIRQIENKHKDILVVLLDIKKLYNQIAYDITRSNAQEKISELTRRIVQKRVFPRHADILEFTSWLLAGEPDDADSPDSIQLSQFSDLSHEIASEVGESATRHQQCQQIREHFLTHRPRFGEIWKQVAPRLNTVHIILASVGLRHYKRAIVVYDNVDRLPSELQPFLLMVANDSNNAVSHVCTTAISIRKENIRRPPDTGDGGDYIHVMSLGDDEYPKILLPSLGLSHARNVLERRYDFTNKAIRGWNGGGVSEEVALKMTALHAGIIGEFNANSIHSLANGSLRNIASIYIGFVRYLRMVALKAGMDYAGFVDQAKIGERHLRTLFFLWLREEGKSHGVILYDIVKKREQDSDVKTFSDLASEHHLLMSCIYNMTSAVRHDGGRNYPLVSSVFEKMVEVGFSSTPIKKAIAQLCGGPGEQPRVLELMQSDFDFSKVAEDSDEPIGLTVLGNELITSVYSAVGFVWGQAYHQEMGQTGRGRSYHEMTTDERIDLLYGYVERLSASHIKMLSLLREIWLPRYGDSWIERYRKIFGINKRFLVERIIDSAVAFYRPLFVGQGEPHPFIAIGESYAKLLSQLRDRMPLEKLDLGILGQGRRPAKGTRQRKGSGL